MVNQGYVISITTGFLIFKNLKVESKSYENNKSRLDLRVLIFRENI